MNQQWSPEVLLPKIVTPARPSANATDNPQEGSSWMYQRPSVNVHEDRSQTTSHQNNSSHYQSRVQFTPDHVSSQNANSQPALATSTAETYSSRKGGRIFPWSPLSLRNSDILRETVFHSDVQNDDDTEEVSSSNVDDETIPLALITQRRRMPRRRVSSVSR